MNARAGKVRKSLIKDLWPQEAILDFLFASAPEGEGGLETPESLDIPRCGDTYKICSCYMVSIAFICHVLQVFQQL